MPDYTVEQLEYAMYQADLVILFDFMYWVNHKLLEVASSVDDEYLTSTSPVTVRNLHATLVHELDVEWSWRLSLVGDAPNGWESELRPEEFASIEELRSRWAQDEAEMRAWLASLTDEAIADLVHPALGDRPRPLWQYLMHIVTHACQQQADAATQLTRAAQSPGELGFADYLAWRDRSPA